MTPDIKNLMILPYTFVPDRFMVDVVDAEIADSDLSAAQAKFFRNNAENTLTFFVEYMKEKGFVFAAEAPKEDTSPPGAVDQHVMSRSEAELVRAHLKCCPPTGSLTVGVPFGTAGQHSLTSHPKA